MEHGFITPAALHYVRNHGAVPKIAWETHTLSVTGKVKKPTTFTMADLLKLPSRELPVTLVCAGNRRKEENLVAQTIGFNWGAAGVGTSTWKGVPLHEVLKACGIMTPDEGAHHVCFVGVEKMPKGRYGTSIDYFTAMNPAEDVLLAWEQNGELLTPDHGFPLRLIIPGYIGGRMIKWLNEIEVTTEESDNFFHFNDNRVLPEHVTAEIANAEGWWYKPDYIINQLNINSAIASPGHLQVIPLKGGAQPHTVSGYCYTGGGRKIIRVELSVDGGKNWVLTKINRPEKPTEYGRYWCWVFWEWEIDISTLFMTEGAELLVRGWDAAQNRQPEQIVWNVMGMMNNSYFRIKVHRCMHPDTGQPALRFVHPTLAGPGNFGGWFEEKVFGPMGAEPAKALAPVAATPTTAAATTTGSKKTYTMEEVAKHTAKDDVWFVVKGKVYNGTPFLADHPGGGSSILLTGGTDCTEEFEALHSSKAWKMLEDYYLGELVESKEAKDDPTGTPAPAEQAKAKAVPVTLTSNAWVSLKLQMRKDISLDTRLFRFALPTPEHVLGLPVGQHLLIKGKKDGRTVIRAYTPVGDGVGYVDFVIKVYFANVHPKFPEGGALSQTMELLQVGDSMDFKGPMGEFVFNTTLPKGLVKQPDAVNTFTQTLTGNKRMFRSIGFISGGTGITPTLQTALALLAQKDANVQIWILYANKSASDILCTDLLQEVASDPRCKVWYTLDTPPAEGWDFSSGFINEQMCRDHLPAPADDAVIFMCGPPPMLQFCCIPSLLKIGHKESNYFCF